MYEPVVAVDADWPAVRLGAVLQRVVEVGQPELPLLSVSAQRGVTLRGEDWGDGLRAASEDLSGYLVVRPGDIVVNKLAARDGAFGRSDHHGLTSPAYFVLRPVGGIEPRFVDYLLHAAPYISEIRRRSKWMPPAQFDISWELLRSMMIRIPDVETQARVADFLDRETQRIDLARHQIQSLEQAFNERSRAVQGRLLLEDLEESQRPIWSCVSLNPDTLPEDTDADVEFEYIDISSVSSDGIADLESVAFGSAPSRARRIVRERDVIISTVRTYLRAVAAVPSSLDGAVASTGFAVLRPLPAVVDARYLRYWCMTDAFLSEVVARSYGVSYPAINASELVRLKMPVPSMARQVKVVTELEALEHQTAKQRHYLSLLDSLLSERRQALITATVTGQLDVEAVA